MVLVHFDNDRTWKGLLVLGLVLNLLVCFTSDLGLDTQVKMAVDENGALPWGDLRPEVAGFSDVDDTGDRSVLPLYQTSESLIKATGLVVFLGLIAYVYRSVGLRSAAVLSISPAFIFSIGRGYEEVYFALLFALSFGLFSGLWSQRNRALQHLIGGFLLMLIPYAKSMAGPTEVLLGGAALAAISMAWLMAQSREEMRFQWTKQPITAAGVVAGATLLFIAIIGLTRSSPTLAVMLDHPLRYVSAVGFALLIGVVIFALFGMVLWPLVTPAHKALRSIHDAQIATMTSMISAATTALVLYIAALWTYESVLWDAAWPGVVVTMGNNGRYLTLLFIPVVVLLKHLGAQQGTPTLDAPAGKAASIALTLLLLLPISLLAGIHGQTMWTDEAAEVMPLEDGDHFLFVSDATLGMHWMYTFYEPLDAEANNITGHWRSLDVNWVDDLNQNLPQVTAIVLSPDVNEVPTGWVVQSSGEADLLNGGGEWRVLTRT